jgi:hypothetical protein
MEKNTEWRRMRRGKEGIEGEEGGKITKARGDELGEKGVLKVTRLGEEARGTSRAASSERVLRGKRLTLCVESLMFVRRKNWSITRA